MRLTPSDKVYVSRSKVHGAGRGVFARDNIKKGEIIEKCPFIEIPQNDLSNLVESILVSYFFYFGKKKNRAVLVLGYGSLFNHSDLPNATFKFRKKEKIIEFIAVDDIKKDTEITFNYYGVDTAKERKDPLWFEES